MAVFRFLRMVSSLLLLTFAVHANEAEDLYTEHCAICHGSEGDGGVGIPLSLDTFLQQTPDEYLKRTIRFGRPGRIMPAFPQLSDRQVDLIVSHIRGWSASTPPAWDDSPQQGSIEKGFTLYNQYCASCHGKQGKGGQGTGVMFSRKKDLPIMAPAIGNPGFLSSASDHMMKRIIIEGRPTTPMQSAKNLGLNETDVNNIVAYLRSLQKPLLSTAKAPEEEPAALVYESAYSLEETIDNVKRAAIGMNFRLIRDQALDEGMVSPGKESRKHVIVYFCNFKFIYDALAIDPQVGLFLPGRITVVETNNKVQVMSNNPKRLSRLFNNNNLDRACDEIYKLYTSILEESTL